MDASTHQDGVVSGLCQNARDLELELDWFAQVIETRNRLYFGKEPEHRAIFNPDPPDLSRSDSPYAAFLRDFDVCVEERLVVLLALIPHIRPQLLDVLWSRNDATQRGFTEFGGLHGAHHSGFIPTGETALYILAGDDLATRFRLMHLFEGDHFFARHNILALSPIPGAEALLAGALTLNSEYRQRFTTGLADKPAFNVDFPARRIETQLAWNSLILPQATLEQIEEIKNWILHSHRLLHEWEMAQKLRPGFVCLFHGPPGTGKTLSACLLGKHCGCDVYKIDLSMIVSKYIGETEKNLGRIFDRAEQKGWILFFDEADALFGRRTRVDTSHDRYANQESSFLLQRIEEFRGVVILASNLKANIDEAFLRRFDSIISFPMPRPDERLRIWQNAFSPKTSLDPSVDMPRLAENFEVSGGTIMNVVRYSSLRALSRNENIIRLEELEEGIRREYLKEGRVM
jgi:hypothetical protein